MARKFTANIASYILTKLESTASNIKMNGSQSAGISEYMARADHVHPVDTSRASSDHTHTGSQLRLGSSGSDANVTIQEVVNSKAASSHTHGNIKNTGAIGTAENKPIITTTSGKLTTGSFGNAANTFCEGNDSRLSDARTPSSHAHGNIDNDGKIGTTANKPIITTTGGVLTTGNFGTSSGEFAEGNHTHNDGYSSSFLVGDGTQGISLTKINGIAIVSLNNYSKSYSATGWQTIVSTGLTNRTGQNIYASNGEYRFRITSSGNLQMNITTTGTVYTGWAQIIFPYS